MADCVRSPAGTGPISTDCIPGQDTLIGQETMRMNCPEACRFADWETGRLGDWERSLPKQIPQSPSPSLPVSITRSTDGRHADAPALVGVLLAGLALLAVAALVAGGALGAAPPRRAGDERAQPPLPDPDPAVQAHPAPGTGRPAAARCRGSRRRPRATPVNRDCARRTCSSGCAATPGDRAGVQRLHLLPFGYWIARRIGTLALPRPPGHSTNADRIDRPELDRRFLDQPSQQHGLPPGLLPGGRPKPRSPTRSASGRASGRSRRWCVDGGVSS